MKISVWTCITVAQMVLAGKKTSVWTCITVAQMVSDGEKNKCMAQKNV